VDERYHVDVGTWLNMTNADESTFFNSQGDAEPRFTGRVGIFDGEFSSDDVNSPFNTGELGGSCGVPTDVDKFAGDAGNIGKWGQGKWNAAMSTATSAYLPNLKKVPESAVFGKGQMNGGFACHSSAQAATAKLALCGKATPCTMAAAMANTDVCHIFAKANGTMGWKSGGNLQGTNAGLELIGAHLLVTFIFLDSSERRLFAANAHEYLITQCQMQTVSTRSIAFGGTPTQIAMDLKFNHPVSHLFWVLQRPESEWAREWFRYEATHGAGDPLMIKAELSLNSSKREEENYMNAMNTTVIEPWNYFKKCNNTGVGGALKNGAFDGSARNIHTYSFAQNPGEWYPTGSLNFSRIDRVELKLFCKSHAESHMTHPLVWGGGGYRELNTEITNASQTDTVDLRTSDSALKAAYGEISNGINVRVYARNFNVLRIQSGMGAIKYAN
jgi:hypothetical protein